MNNPVAEQALTCPLWHEAAAAQSSSSHFQGIIITFNVSYPTQNQVQPKILSLL
jgi:hypothetical protein